MKRKFKVGDRVRILDGSNIPNYAGGWCPSVMKDYVGQVFEISRVMENGYMIRKSVLLWDERGLELADKKETIVIYRKGDEVIALDKVSGKTGVAKCGRNDTFDFATGARIAFERLLEEPKPEEPKYFTGKVVCTYAFGSGLTEGKVYVITNGVGYGDNGTPLTNRPIESVVELNRRLISHFLEIKEDPKPEEPEKTPLNVKIVFTNGDMTFKTGHIYEVKDGNLVNPQNGKLLPGFSCEGFGKFYSIAELKDYFTAFSDRKLHTGGWSFHSLEFIVIEED